MNDFSKKPSFKLMIIPGNGCSNIEKANWYYWLSKNLQDKFPSSQIICSTMPDPFKAREKNWIPFIKEKLKDSDIIYVIGHSSGAVCIMRLLESLKVKGAVIVSGSISDLGEESEKISGYYPQQPNSDELRPWNWDIMKANSDWLIHLGSKDDQFIPFDEIIILFVPELETATNKFNSGLQQTEFQELSADEIVEVINSGCIFTTKNIMFFFEKSAKRGHFMTSTFPELLTILTERIDKDLKDLGINN